MIVRVARKETLEMLRDGRFRWAAGFVLVLLLGSMLVGWRHYAEVQAQHTAAQRDVWVNQGERNPHAAAHYGTYAFKPVTAPSAIDRGVTPYTGVAIFLEGHVQNAPSYRPAEDATAAARLGELTAAATLQYLIPLLIVLLAFSAFAGEREAGTLRQLLSLGVPRRTLAWGKALGTALPLAVILVPAALVGVTALALSADPAQIAWSLPRLGSMAGVYLLYFGIFIGVSLIVSALAPSSRAALVLLLGFWLTNAFVAPRVANNVAAALVPTPTLAEWAAAERAHHDAKPEWQARMAAVTDRLVAEHGVTSPDELPVDPLGVALVEDEEESTAFYREQFAQLAATYERQLRVYQAGAFLAPLLAVQPLGMALAGTDHAHYQHFSDAAEAYRHRMVQILNEDLAQNARSAENPRSYTVGREMWEDTISPFEYRAPGLFWALDGRLLALLILGLWVVGVVVLTPIAVARARMA
jgi:ABC-2 type transport system permease protein